MTARRMIPGSFRKDHPYSSATVDCGDCGHVVTDAGDWMHACHQAMEHADEAGHLAGVTSVDIALYGPDGHLVRYDDDGGERDAKRNQALADAVFRLNEVRDWAERNVVPLAPDDSHAQALETGFLRAVSDVLAILDKP